MKVPLAIILLLLLVLFIPPVSAAYADDVFTTTLLHFDDVNNGTNFTDSTGRVWVNARAMSATNITKFGIASGYFNETAYINTTPSDTLNFTAGDWTIDAWVMHTSDYASSRVFTIFGDQNDDKRYMAIEGGKLKFLASGANYATGATTLLKNTWYHTAAVRNGTTTKIYLNGVYEGGFTDALSYEYQQPVIGRGNPINRYFMGHIDELRVTKGLARWTANFTPPTYAYMMTAAAFTTNASTVHVAPYVIQFNDTTLDSAWTNNTWQWDFGDAGVSSLQNPTHTYATGGAKTVTLTTANKNMSSVATQTVNIGVPNADFYGTPTSGSAALLVTFHDTTTNISPITAYNISYGDGYYDEGAGPWSHVYSSYGAFDVNLSITSAEGTGYTLKSDYITVTSSDSSYDWVPRETKLTVVNTNYVNMVGVSVNATAISSTFPSGTDWLKSMYSMDAGAANEMLNGTLIMSGITQSDGGLTFTMHPSIAYMITVTDPVTGATRTVNITPDERTYTIILTGSVSTRNSTYSSMGGNTSLYVTEPDINNVLLGLRYQDMSGRTSLVEFYVVNRSNSTLVYYDSVASPGSNYVYMNYTVPNIKHHVYSWYYNAVRVV